MILRRCLIIGGLLIVSGLAHWLIPIESDGGQWYHAIHVLMRKLFILPVILGAIWFNLRGAVLVAAVASLIFVPHVIYQWETRPVENINQIGELASMWIVALLSGWLVSREKTALKEVDRAHQGALLALLGALDEREHDTQTHSLRVRAYALEIARQMGLPPADIDALNPGALLHDVGKIGIPDEILLKPTSLSDDEWRIMRQHPEIGRHILQPVAFFGRAIDVVYAHHERMDGNGYPQGLRGNQIPLIARVFAVADALDAITSKRPYKDAMSIEEARARILNDTGSQFDPDVVDAFLAVPLSRWQQIRADIEPASADQSFEE